MKKRSELEELKKTVEVFYNSCGNLLMVDGNKKFNPSEPEISYCYSYFSETTNKKCYVVRHVTTESERTNLRILLHEYGHIYCGHLDGVHEELDTQLRQLLVNNKAEFIDKLNESLEIDFADELINAVITDETINNTIHNIAMDFEVNSKVLSKDDIDELRIDLESLYPSGSSERSRLEENKILDKEQESTMSSEELEILNSKINLAIESMKSETKLKLVGPWMFKDKSGKVFPDCLSYPTYLSMIIENLDQFIKLMVDLSKGGDGSNMDNITPEDIKDALEAMGSGSSMQSLKDLINTVANTGNGKSQQDKGDLYNNFREDVMDDLKKNRGEGYGNQNQKSAADHDNPEREAANSSRGEKSYGVGSEHSGGSYYTPKEKDDIDIALDEILKENRSRVLKYKMFRDRTFYYNRGINRTVLTPKYGNKILIDNKPKLVFLIDVSGSMDTGLVSRVVNSIAKNIKRLNRSLRYDIITWDTDLCEHYKNIDPTKPAPKIPYGGGTSIARGIKYFHDNFGPENQLIIISDFEDYLQEWHKAEEKMKNYVIWGLCYDNECDFKFDNIRVRNLKSNRY